MNSDSQALIGEISDTLEEDTIWYKSSANANVIGEREVLLYGKPPRVWTVGTGLPALDRTLGEHARLVNSFFGVFSDSVWKITNQEIDMNSCRVDLSFDSAFSLRGFYLDITSLDTTSEFLI